MARANRHYIPGCIWHITHRCHKKEFLLKFAQDRSRFVSWLYEARTRFGVQVLNYAITCNHVHLLIKDGKEKAVIPSAIQLVAGRTAQEYNARKRRKGAFWEDRYHATAIESGEHLRRCLVYIDLNMVRAGVVRHPVEWAHGGYHEIQGGRRRNTVLALDALAEAAETGSVAELARTHGEWISAALATGSLARSDDWTKSLAVGSAAFVERVSKLLGSRTNGRSVMESDGRMVLREPSAGYGLDSDSENRAIAAKNTFFWEPFALNTGG